MADLHVQRPTGIRHTQYQTGRAPLVIGVVLYYLAAAQQRFLNFRDADVTQYALVDGVPGEFVSTSPHFVADSLQRSHIA